MTFILNIHVSLLHETILLIIVYVDSVGKRAYDPKVSHQGLSQDC